MSPSWRMALLEPQPFSKFCNECAKVISHMSRMPHIAYCKSVQLIRLDDGLDRLHCNYAGMACCYMADMTPSFVMNLIGYDKNYGAMKQTLDEIGAWDISSVLGFFESNSIERCALSYHRWQERMGHTFLPAQRDHARLLERHYMDSLGGMNGEESSFYGNFCARLMALAYISNAIETELFINNKLITYEKANQNEQHHQ